MTELKPCPFCGKPVSFVYNSFDDAFKFSHKNGDDEEKCCVIGEIWLKGKSLADATENWNRINRQQIEIDSWQSGYMTQKEEIANLEIELKAMRGAANSYKAEIERLKDDNKFLQDNRWKELSFVKAEAYNECLLMVKKLWGNYRGYDFEMKLDNLLKEMGGDNK